MFNIATFYFYYEYSWYKKMKNHNLDRILFFIVIHKRKFRNMLPLSIFGDSAPSDPNAARHRASSTVTKTLKSLSNFYI